MIKGIGLDMIDLERVKQVLKRIRVLLNVF